LQVSEGGVTNDNHWAKLHIELYVGLPYKSEGEAGRTFLGVVPVRVLKSRMTRARV